jgi:hypothetical protein
MGLLPLAGGIMMALAFVRSIYDQADPTSSYTCEDPEDAATCASLFGVGVPLALSIIFLVAGIVLMIAWWIRHPSFFRWKPEAYDPARTPAETFEA